MKAFKNSCTLSIPWCKEVKIIWICTGVVGMCVGCFCEGVNTCIILLVWTFYAMHFSFFMLFFFKYLAEKYVQDFLSREIKSTQKKTVCSDRVRKGLLIYIFFRVSGYLGSLMCINSVIQGIIFNIFHIKRWFQGVIYLMSFHWIQLYLCISFTMMKIFPLTGGCMHLLCSRCGAEWCWLCVKKWDRQCQGAHWFDWGMWKLCP